MGNQLFTLYEIKIERLSLILSDGTEKVFPEALASGRTNYLLFEELVREFANLKKAKGSDHQDFHGKLYEQKSYEDPEAYPQSKDLFRCSSSSTFGANNHGPKVKRFLDNGDYKSALQLCMETGYDKNDYYVFTNSGNYTTAIPFRYFIIPKTDLVDALDSNDPRLVSKTKLFSMIESKVILV